MSKYMQQSETENIVKNIAKHLSETYNYPSSTSDNFKYDYVVIKATGERGFVDAVYFSDEGKIALLLEAKKESHKLNQKDVEQLFSYAQSLEFKYKQNYPPCLLLTNFKTWKWYQLSEITKGEPIYVEVPEIHWSQARKLASTNACLRPSLSSINELISEFKNIRQVLYDDLKSMVYVATNDSWSLDNLTVRERNSIEEILRIRETYLGDKPSSALTKKQIEAAIGSIALSYTMKICFYKLLTDCYEDFKSNKSLNVAMAELSSKYGKLFNAKPYDVLEPSKECFGKIEKLLGKFGSVHAIQHEDKINNPIGQLYEALIDELQVETLGAVFTPDDIVKFMCDLSEKKLKGFRNKKILEPACGSGHFVREIYRRYVEEILNSNPKVTQKAVVDAHIEALKNIRAIDVDAFSCQATMFALFLEQVRGRN